jgi:hypothetical protein
MKLVSSYELMLGMVLKLLFGCKLMTYTFQHLTSRDMQKGVYA